MSYEGSVRYLCETGHLVETDCYDKEITICPTCNNEITWRESRDETNCCCYRQWFPLIMGEYDWIHGEQLYFVPSREQLGKYRKLFRKYCDACYDMKEFIVRLEESENDEENG